MNKPRSFEEILTLLNQLNSRVERIEKQDQDFHGRKVINAGNAVNPQDYTTLHDVENKINVATSSFNLTTEDTDSLLAGNSVLHKLIHIFNSVVKATVGVITNLIYPSANSTTAIKFTKADGTTAIITIDSSTPEVLINAVLRIYNTTLGDFYIGVDATHKMRIVYVGGSNGAINTLNSGVYTPLNIDADGLILNSTSNGAITVGSATSTIGFFAATAAAKQTLNAYTTNSQSSAYSSTPADLAHAATLIDLNALRVAYETLRASYDDLRTKLKVTTLVA